MAQFFATSPAGLSNALFEELRELGFKGLQPTSHGVYFEGNWRECYRANLCSGIASRILKPLLEFTCYQYEELYGQIRQHDFTKYIELHQTLFIDSKVSESKLHDQRMVTLKIKDAICDQFREKSGTRPDIGEADVSDLQLAISLTKNNCHVSLNTSGASLFKRGYRTQGGDASLKENLAYGMLRLSGWKKDQTLIDPFCGSGTILIEAARWALNIPPGADRKRFGFEKLLHFNQAEFDEVASLAFEGEKKELPFQLLGSDLDRDQIKKAQANARRAGVDHVVEFSTRRMNHVEPSPEAAPGMMITNPPYGKRLDQFEIEDLYKDFGFTLKNKFPNWNVWILSGDPHATKHLKLQSEKKFALMNGPIDCRFLNYKINKIPQNLRHF